MCNLLFGLISHFGLLKVYNISFFLLGSMLTMCEIDEVLSGSKSQMYMTQFELGIMYARGKNRMLSLFMVHVRGLGLMPYLDMSHV